MAAHPGFKALGSFLGGGNTPNAAIAEAQGEQLGASTQDSIAQALLRQQEREGRASVGPAAAALPGSSPELGNFLGAAATGHINPQEYTASLDQSLKTRAGELALNTA